MTEQSKDNRPDRDDRPRTTRIPLDVVAAPDRTQTRIPLDVVARPAPARRGRVR